VRGIAEKGRKQKSTHKKTTRQSAASKTAKPDGSIISAKAVA
jgi:hypothetical protein